MPATAQQVSDLRNDIGDNGATPVFDQTAIDRLLARAEAYSSDTTVIEAQMRVLAIRQMLGDAAKLWNYKQNQSTDNMSDVFNHLKDLLALWSGIRDDAVTANSGGGAVWASMKKKPSRTYEVPDS